MGLLFTCECLVEYPPLLQCMFSLLFEIYGQKMEQHRAELWAEYP